MKPLCLALAVLLANFRSAAATLDADLCRRAASDAERSYDLPPGVLHAISDVETGRVQTGHLAPWPWTVTANGQGYYFANKSSAVAWVESARARGIASIDVGCMQVNLYFHPDAFADLDQAFDPGSNALYAARFLRTLHARTGDWDRAIGLYHSETASLAAPYRARVERILAISPVPTPPTTLQQLSVAWSATLPPSSDLITADGLAPTEPIGSWSR